jgi:hypothetical protein
MTTELDYLQVKGDQIVNSQGENVHLTGFCLGGWLNMENFMVGYPGTESDFRKALADVLGEAKAAFAFERFLHYFASEADFHFIKSLGCNLVRVAFNYHHFEDDQDPGNFKEDGFTWFDKVLGWGKKAGVHVVLDFHAVQGWQSSGWHCDNPGGPPQFWVHPHFEDRAVALWEAIAKRYKDEPAVAMYGIMNEPEAHDATRLNHYNARVAEAIRTIDTRHILNFEGNHYSQDFSQLDPPIDPNAVYASHLYVPPGLDDVRYPGLVGGTDYNRETIEGIYRQRRDYCARHGVPHWMSEFGPIYNQPDYLPDKLRVLADHLDIIESYGDHWTIWNYKDIGKMGIVTVDPESPWMQRIGPVHQVKAELRCDSWVDRVSPTFDAHLSNMSDHIQSRFDSLQGEWSFSKEQLGFAVGDRFLSNLLLPAFAEQFRDMTETEIDEMMASFAFENCIQRSELVALIKEDKACTL